MRILVGGAGGFIGGHLVKRLKQEGYWVRGVDLKRHEYCARRLEETYGWISLQVAAQATGEKAVVTAAGGH